jgi:hypothetical protein
METFERAAGAGMLFVHHGLFWGAPLRLTGGHRECGGFVPRIRKYFKEKSAQYRRVCPAVVFFGCPYGTFIAM